MVDTQVTRKGFDRIYISDIWRILSGENVADRLIKFEKSPALEDFLDTTRIRITFQYWVIFKDVSIREGKEIW